MVIIQKETNGQRKKRKRSAKMRKKHRNVFSSTVIVSRSLRRRITLGQKYRRQKLEGKLPAAFSFAEDQESVLGFLNSILELYGRNRNKVKGHSFFFDLSEVESIDTTAICLFLSLINRLNANGVGSRGNYPKNAIAKKTIVESGFSDIMQSAVKRLKTKRYTNQLYIVGTKRVDNKRIGQSVREAVGYLIGEEAHFNPVYTMLIEICSNSVEHANRREQDKNWVVSVSYEGDRVRFIVVDAGDGILRTIYKKLPEMFVDTLFREDGRVLEDILNKAYQSRTKEVNRHKGLPKVKDCFDNGYVSELKILTNNVLYDMPTAIFQRVKNEYYGVLYSWSITKDNYIKWKRR